MGCPGCRAVNRNLPAVNHNEECRQRIEDHLRSEGSQKLMQSEERFNRREEDRANRKRKLAGDNPEEIARGGVESGTAINQDNGVDVDIGD